MKAACSARTVDLRDARQSRSLNSTTRESWQLRVRQRETNRDNIRELTSLRVANRLHTVGVRAVRHEADGIDGSCYILGGEDPRYKQAQVHLALDGKTFLPFRWIFPTQADSRPADSVDSQFRRCFERQID